jgi:hypothetical protein
MFSLMLSTGLMSSSPRVGADPFVIQGHAATSSKPTPRPATSMFKNISSHTAVPASLLSAPRPTQRDAALPKIPTPFSRGLPAVSRAAPPTPSPAPRRPPGINVALGAQQTKTWAELNKVSEIIPAAIEYMRSACWCCWARGISSFDHPREYCWENIAHPDDPQFRRFCKGIVLTEGWCFYCTVPQVRRLTPIHSNY